MSSKKKQAAQAAANAAKPAETAKVDNTTKATTEKENKGTAKAETPAAAPAPQPKKKEEKKTEAKTEKQPAQKVADTQPKLKKDKTPVVIAEEVDETTALGNKIGVPLSNTGMDAIKRSSTDAKAQLVTYGYNRFINNEEFKDKCPEAWKHTAQVCDVVWLLAMVDIRNEVAALKSGGQIVAKIPEDQLMPLNEVAEMLGITLAAPKAIVGPQGEKQLAIDFTSPDTIVPEELNDKKAPVQTVPDLDYGKVGTDHEKICAALDYLMHQNRDITVCIDKTLEWYRGLCMNNASSADAKLALDAKPLNEWIDEIFHLIPIAGLMKGLGRSVYLYTKQQGSPVSAHSILHGKLPNWSEEDIVSLLKVLIQENYRYSLEDKIDANGNVIKTEKPKPTEDKAIQSVVGSVGLEYVDKLMADYTRPVPENATDEQLMEIKESRAAARKIISLVRANYYPGKVEPTNEQIRFAIGKIINVYRQPMDQIAEFEGPLPTLVGEYPETPKTEDKPAEEKKS